MKQNVKQEIDHVVTGFSLFCDDVRLETSGKLCFIGQYPGDILVAGLQTPIDRIAIVTFARWKNDQPVKSLAARTEVPGLAPLISQMATFPIGTNVMVTEPPLRTAQAVTFLRFPQLRIGDVIRCWLVVDGIDVFAGECYIRAAIPPAHGPTDPLASGATRH